MCVCLAFRVMLNGMTEVATPLLAGSSSLGRPIGDKDFAIISFSSPDADWPVVHFRAVIRGAMGVSKTVAVLLVTASALAGPHT